MLPTPVELRDQSRLYRDAARQATDVGSKRRLATCALAFAQIAEMIERDGRIDEFVTDHKLDNLLANVDPAVRQIVGTFLIERRSDPVTRVRIRSWRMRAEELRTAAEEFAVLSARESLLRAADNYDKLADRAERSFDPPKSSSGIC